MATSVAAQEVTVLQAPAHAQYHRAPAPAAQVLIAAARQAAAIAAAVAVVEAATQAAPAVAVAAEVESLMEVAVDDV